MTPSRLKAFTVVMVMLATFLAAFNDHTHLYDGGTYTFAAQSYVDDGVFRQSWDNNPRNPDQRLDIFPAGYPLLLSIIMRTGISAIAAGVAINVASAGMIAGLLFYLLRHYTLSIQIAMVAAFITLPGVALALDAPITEPVFAVLMLAEIALIEKPNPRRMVAAGLIMGLAGTIRYAALLIIVANVAAFWLAGYKRRDALAYALLGILPVGLILVTNTLTTGYASGTRGEVAFTLLEIIVDVAEVLFNWGIWYAGFIALALVTYRVRGADAGIERRDDSAQPPKRA